MSTCNIKQQVNNYLGVSAVISLYDVVICRDLSVYCKIRDLVMATMNRRSDHGKKNLFQGYLILTFQLRSDGCFSNKKANSAISRLIKTRPIVVETFHLKPSSCISIMDLEVLALNAIFIFIPMCVIPLLVCSLHANLRPSLLSLSK